MIEYKAKETYYNGIMFRSRNEAKWARLFDLIRIGYEYEPVTVTGWNGYRYKPDFFFPEYEKYAEVKTSDEGLHNEVMAQKLCGAIDYQQTEVSQGLLLLGSFPFDVRVRDVRLRTKWLFWHKGVCCSDAYIQEDVLHNYGHICFAETNIDCGEPLPSKASTDIYVEQYAPGNYLSRAINDVNDYFSN